MRKACRQAVIPVIVVTVMALLVVAGGCAAPAASPTAVPAKPAAAPTIAPARPAAAPTAAPAQPAAAPSAKPIELKLFYPMASTYFQSTKVVQPFAKDLEDKSGGRLKVTVYYEGSLGASKDAYDLVKNGIADMYFGISYGYFPGIYKLSNVLGLPFITKSGITANKAMAELYKKGLLDSDYKDVHPFSFGSTSTYALLTKKQVNALSDLKGRKIRSSGGPPSQALEAAGATPVSMTSAELYSSLQKGIVDGALYIVGGAFSDKLYEVTKYAVVGVDPLVVPTGSVMNNKTWQSLPKDLQDVVTQVGADGGMRLTQAYIDEDVKGRTGLESKGVVFSDFPAAERDKWKAAASDIAEKWIKDMEGQGLPGRKAYDDALSLVRDFEKQ